MSVNMFLESADGQVTAIKNMCQMHISEMEAVKKAIAQFTAETALKGQAYDSAKQFFEAVYVPLANGFILIAETLQKAAKKMVDEYRTEVDGNSLQEEALRNQIHQLANLIEESAICFAPPATDLSANGISANPFLPFYEDQKRDIQKKLDKLMAYDGVSATLFAEVEGLFNNVEAGLIALARGKEFNATTGIFDVSAIESSWIKAINTSYGKYIVDNINSKIPNLNAQDIANLKNYAADHPNEDMPKSWQNWLINMIQGGYGYVGQYSADITSLISLGVVKFGGIKTVLEALARSDGPNPFVMVNQAGKGPSIVQKGLKLGKFAKTLGPALSVVGFGIGVTDDMMNGGKTLGEATMHSGTSTVVGVGGAMAGSALTTTALVALGVSNPVGWAILGGAAVGFVAVQGFEYLYDNNILGIKDGLDWTGDKIDQGLNWAGDKIGEGVENVGNALNPMNWGW
ncbi:hypothetical protein HCX57_00395 [Listeria welshimeri]|nr:hypothetical protein [Listeria welshimeri]